MRENFKVAGTLDSLLTLTPSHQGDVIFVPLTVFKPSLWQRLLSAQGASSIAGSILSFHHDNAAEWMIPLKIVIYLTHLQF